MRCLQQARIGRRSGRRGVSDVGVQRRSCPSWRKTSQRKRAALAPIPCDTDSRWPATLIVVAFVASYHKPPDPPVSANCPFRQLRAKETDRNNPIL
jgi:hypothetical protein